MSDSLLSIDHEFAAQAGVLAQVKERAEVLGLPFVVAGALARDIVIHSLTGRLPERATDDVDVAVAVSSWEELDSLLQGLGVAGSSEHQVLVGGTELDAAVLARLDGVTVKVASLAAQTILKFQAWSERGNRTTKDAIDLRLLLRASDVIASEDRIYASENLLVRYDFDTELVGCDLLGQDAGLLLGAYEADRFRSAVGHEAGQDGRLPTAMGSAPARNRLLVTAWADGLAAGAT
jgi:predicted nucleotidyltransferase